MNNKVMVEEKLGSEGSSMTERLERLGLTAAAQNTKTAIELKRKCLVAYEHFRYVTQDKINRFNEVLRKKTETTLNMYYRNYDQLKMTPLEQYGQVPPANVLDLLEKAQGMRCFDTFEVAKIESVQERIDPIIFGRVTGCPDRFFIGQWDNDVKLEDIITEQEG